jgi:hypothetical protein
MCGYEEGDQVREPICKVGEMVKEKKLAEGKTARWRWRWSC